MLQRVRQRSECEVMMQDSVSDVESNSINQGDRRGERVVSDWALEMAEEEARITSVSVTAHSTDFHPLNSKAAPAVSTTVSYAKALTETPKARKGNTDNTYLPPNHDWTKYVILNCTTRTRPIYTVDVMEAVAKKMDTKNVVSIGAFRSANVFLLELHSLQAKQKLLQQQNIVVAGAEVIVSPAQENHITLTIVNLPHAITLAEVSQAISPWGVAIHQYHLYSPDPRFNHVIINRRKVTVKLHHDTKVDEFPQSLVIASFRVPCFVAGRPPKCYKCGGVGHLLQACPATERIPPVISATRSVNELNNKPRSEGEIIEGEDKITDAHDTNVSNEITDEALEQETTTISNEITTPGPTDMEPNTVSQITERPIIGNNINSTAPTTGHVEETEEDMQITMTQPKRRNDESVTNLSEAEKDQKEVIGTHNCAHISSDASPVKKKQKKQRTKQKKESKNTDDVRSPIALRKSQNSGPSATTVTTNDPSNIQECKTEHSISSTDDESDNG